MEQPPAGLNDLQPQDFSKTSIPAVLDLTRKADLNNKTKDALRVVRSPGWFQNTGTSNTSISCSKTSTADMALLPATQVKPDNAFSHTTVTLSYVNRSHIYPSVESLSEDSSLCSAPSDGTLSRLPPCEGGRDVCENGYHSDHSLSLTVSPNQTHRTFPWLNSDGVSSGDEDHSEIGEKDALPQVSGRIAGEDVTITENDKKTRDTNVPFFSSMNKDCLAVPDNVGVGDLCSVGQQYVSAVDDHLSTSATSLNDGEDVFILPQTSSYPSTVESFLENVGESPCEDLDIIGPEEVQSSVTDVIHGSRLLKGCQGPKSPLLDSTHELGLSGADEEKPKANGNAKSQQVNWPVKKLPVRSNRGMRLEALNMDSCTILPRRYNTPKKASPKKAAVKSKTKTTMPIEKVKQTTGIQQKDSCIDNSDTLKNSTSNSVISQSKQSQASLSPKEPDVAVHKSLRKNSNCLSPTAPSKAVNASQKSSPTPRASPNKEQRSPSNKATAQRTSTTPKTKAAKTPRRPRKRLKQSPSPFMFAPKEPEIKLKYVNYKEEKRDYRLTEFSPFIHVERRPSATSLCTVVNDAEETQHQQLQKGVLLQTSQASTFVSATVPSTSCLMLGRVSSQAQYLRPFVCCLCQLSANAMDLGDLLGPYYSEGHQPVTNMPSGTPGLKDDKEDRSDSDSFCGRTSARRRTPAIPHALRRRRSSIQNKRKGRSLVCHMTDNDCDSLVAKRPRSDVGASGVHDWYSPPVLPIQSSEYWLHEDCGIWAAGVFLVKGKVYGLEEAVKVALETTCSACCTQGAILGCFFKGCPNKYHYRCALQSDCILIEENFSMKCKKHKNKTLSDPVGKRQKKR